MSKVDITPYLPEVEAAVEATLTDPFKAYEPMLLVGTVGKLIYEAEAIQTEEEYKDAWDQLTTHVETKYDLFRKLDDLVKLPVYAEPFDGWAIRKAWDATGAFLAHMAAKHLEDNTTTP